jgi:hypothetical protein
MERKDRRIWSRRRLASMILAAPAATAALPRGLSGAQVPGARAEQDEVRAAQKRNSEALARAELPPAIEPAFRFEA